MLIFSVYGMANSQVLIALVFGDKLNSPDLEFGLTAGASLSTINNIPEAKYRSDLNIGLYFNYRIKGNWWFHPEVQVKSSRGAKGINPYSVDDENLDEIFEEGSVARVINGFTVPLLIKYRWPNSGIGLEGGIEPVLTTTVRDEFYQDLGDKTDVTFRNNIRDNVPRLDFGLAIGASWRPKKDRGVTIVARFTEGLVNTNKNDPSAGETTRAFVFSAHIPIGVKKAEKRRAEKAAEEALENENAQEQQ